MPVYGGSMGEYDFIFSATPQCSLCVDTRPKASQFTTAHLHMLLIHLVSFSLHNLFCYCRAVLNAAHIEIHGLEASVGGTVWCRRESSLRIQ